jgi:hypothetical protein
MFSSFDVKNSWHLLLLNKIKQNKNFTSSCTAALIGLEIWNLLILGFEKKAPIQNLFFT